jgi:hypothetical protein
MKKRRVYKPCVVGGRVMTSADLEHLRKALRDFNRIAISSLTKCAR